MKCSALDKLYEEAKIIFANRNKINKADLFDRFCRYLDLKLNTMSSVIYEVCEIPAQGELKTKDNKPVSFIDSSKHNRRFWVELPYSIGIFTSKKKIINCKIIMMDYLAGKKLCVGDSFEAIFQVPEKLSKLHKYLLEHGY